MTLADCASALVPLAQTLPTETLPTEPVELRDALRALVRQRPSSWEAVAGDGRWIAEPVWAGAASYLPDLDVGVLAAAAVGHRQELWLWMMGERTWEHCVTGLLGRARRRRPASAASDEGRTPKSGGVHR